ncbi:bile acid:sodium symporter family protein [Parvularcula bermudensis]|nr:bile acid:sodium symporter family protein [Parvularcula bermudensis]
MGNERRTDGASGSRSIRERIRIDPFVVAMAATALAGFLVPGPGAPSSPLRLQMVTQVGIALIFFVHGAAFPRQVIVENARRWPVHLLIQGTTFVLFPLIGLVFYYSLGPFLSDSLRLGFFFLAALPSTISSAVAMTAAARGNVPVAVFNASLSGLIGLVVTPALLSMIGSSGTGSLSYQQALIDIAQVLLLPFAAGQLCRPLIADFITRHKPKITRLDRGVILLIVYTAFASSTAAGVWSTVSPVQLAGTIALVMMLLAVALVLVTLAARAIGLSRHDEVSVVFCGSTKSLANGAPMAQVLFAGSGAIGLILLPLMLYHQLQLIACALLAQRYAGQAASEEANETD